MLTKYPSSEAVVASFGCCGTMLIFRQVDVPCGLASSPAKEARIVRLAYSAPLICFSDLRFDVASMDVVGSVSVSALTGEA